MEFALVLPLFMMLMLGMFTGGVAYNQDISLTHAAREGARYGATLPKGTVAPSAWLAAVSTRIEEAAAGELDAVTTPATGHYICVALVDGSGALQGVSPNQYSYRSPNTPTSVPDRCYVDGVVDPSFGRIHVLVGRPGRIQLLVTRMTLNLSSRATARYENPTA